MRSTSDRTVVAGLVIALSVWLAWTSWSRPRTIPDPQPVDGPRAAELATKLDPNIADAGSLSALPGLGEKRAHAIVAYRQEVEQRRPGRPVFQSPQDLMHVPGIGPATAANLSPYLTFPSKQ